MNRARIFRAAAFVVAAGGGLLLLEYLAPLQLPTVMAYFGLGIFLTGLVGCVLPLRWTALGKRVHGLAVAALGIALFAAGLYWPASVHRTPSPATRLDAFLPEYHFEERHELRIQAPPDRVVAALRQITFDDIGVMNTLGRIRNAAMGLGVAQPKSNPLAGVSVIAMMSRGRTGFFPLELGDRELVFGMAGRPWANAAVRLAPDRFREWMPPGNVKIAFNFAAEDAGGGWSRVWTETRVQATDSDARRTMARYWRLIYPGSGMIRRSMLDAVRRKAAAL
jgi:hypothetical protein